MLALALRLSQNSGLGLKLLFEGMLSTFGGSDQKSPMSDVSTLFLSLVSVQRFSVAIFKT